MQIDKQEAKGQNMTDMRKDRDMTLPHKEQQKKMLSNRDKREQAV